MALEMQQCFARDEGAEFVQFNRAQSIFSRFEALNIIKRRILVFVSPGIPGFLIRVKMLVHSQLTLSRQCNRVKVETYFAAVGASVAADVGAAVATEVAAMPPPTRLSSSA